MKITATIQKLFITTACMAACNMALATPATMDSLKEILSTLQSQAQVNYSIGADQETQINAVNTASAAHTTAQNTYKQQTRQTLGSASIPYSSAASVCSLYSSTTTESTTEQTSGKTICPDISAEEQFLYPLFGTMKKNNKDYPDPKIPANAISSLNYANILFPADGNISTNDTTFLSALEDDYRFYQNWLQYTPPPSADGDMSQSTENLITNEEINKISANPGGNSDALNALISYEANYKSSVAFRSIAVTALQSIASERKKNGNTDSALASQEALVDKFTSTGWTNAMSKAGPLTVQKAQLVLLAQIAKQQLQAHLDQERNTALLSAMLLKINALADSNETIMSKQKLAKKLGGLT
jgi:hypothetical protein